LLHSTYADAAAQLPASTTGAIHFGVRRWTFPKNAVTLSGSA
jgi:hypothetical protein